MKVRELIAALMPLPEDAEVIFRQGKTGLVYDVDEVVKRNEPTIHVELR